MPVEQFRSSSNSGKSNQTNEQETLVALRRRKALLEEEQKSHQDYLNNYENHLKELESKLTATKEIYKKLEDEIAPLQKQVDEDTYAVHLRNEPRKMSATDKQKWRELSLVYLEAKKNVRFAEAELHHYTKTELPMHKKALAETTAALISVTFQIARIKFPTRYTPPINTTNPDDDSANNSAVLRKR